MGPKVGVGMVGSAITVHLATTITAKLTTRHHSMFTVLREEDEECQGGTEHCIAGVEPVTRCTEASASPGPDTC